MNIVFLDASTIGKVDCFDKLKRFGDLRVYDFTPEELLVERIMDAEIVLVNKVKISASVMDACTSLKLICVTATGLDNVDLVYAKEKGVEVKNVKGYSTDSVAQATFSMIFHLNNHNAYYDDYVQSGQYSHSKIFTNLERDIFQLKGKRFGVIGFGSIGKKVAEIAKVFGCEVVYYSTSGLNLKQAYEHLDLEELLSTSDFISIHSPLNSKTLGLIGAMELKKMKKSAILVNMGRGGIVNESDLAVALDLNQIRAAGLDVLSQEPIMEGNPLLCIKEKQKLFITPHIAWASVEARNLLMEKVVSHVENYLKTKDL